MEHAYSMDLQIKPWLEFVACREGPFLLDLAFWPVLVDDHKHSL
jgi:hypothetical protein